MSGVLNFKCHSCQRENAVSTAVVDPRDPLLECRFCGFSYHASEDRELSRQRVLIEVASLVEPSPEPSEGGAE